MIVLGKNECICQKYSNPNPREVCKDQYTLSEEGKSITLKPRIGEDVMTIVLDKCIIDDNNTKCDGLFLYKTSSKKHSFLVELKGAGEIEKAFVQLSYTKYNRKEYKNIINLFYQLDNQKVLEKFAIVSNGSIEKTRLEILENQYNIRVKKILHSEATTPIPDLKELI